MTIRLIDRYPNRAGSSTISYPHGSYRNKTSPTADDGTPLEQDWSNDREAFFQALIEDAGVTPNGNVDTVPDSQLIDALNTLVGARTVDSVSELNSSSFRDSVDRIWLSGYSGVGTEGGGPLYRKGTGFSSSDENGILFVDSDGVGWKAGPGFVLAANAELRVPSDFATLQEAVDGTSDLGVTQGTIIDVLIESGHQPESGVSVFNGDYGHYQISSEDAVVSLPSAFNAGRFINSGYSVAPTLNCLVDSQGYASRGYNLLGGSGHVNSGCGVKNVAGEALWIYHCVFSGNSSIWSGAVGYAVRASRGTIFTLADADLTNCDGTSNANGVVYPNRGSVGNMQGCDFSGCIAQKLIYCHRSSKLNAHMITAKNIECTFDVNDAFNACFTANRASELDVNNSNIDNVTGNLFACSSASTLNAEGQQIAINGTAGNNASLLLCTRNSRAVLGGPGFNDFVGDGVTCQAASSALISGSIDGCNTGLLAKDSGIISAAAVTITNSVGVGVLAADDSKINLRDGESSGSGGDDLVVQSGSFINAKGVSTTNGAGAPDSSDTSPGTYNALSGRGVIWA